MFSFTAFKDINFGYHAKQFAKGLAVLGLGTLAYLGLSSLFSSKTKSDSKIEEIDADDLALREKRNLPNEKVETILDPRIADLKLDYLAAENGVPTLINNTLSLKVGETVTLTNENLAASPQNVTFIVSDVQYGQFEFANGTLTTNFAADDIGNSIINFRHAGGFSAPAYLVIVNDGQNSTLPNRTRVAFSYDCPTKLGPEFQVNTYTSDAQINSAVAGLAGGKFVVVWDSNGQDGSSRGIYGQMYYNNGTKFNNEFRVNTYTANYQEMPIITGLNDGKFVIAWHGYGLDPAPNGIYAKIYYADGTISIPDFLVNTYTSSGQSYPTIASLANDKFIVAWHSSYQVGTEFDYDVFAQMYLMNGDRYGNEFQVNTYVNNSQLYPSTAGLSDGKFVITWDSYSQDESDYGVYAQIFNDSNVKFGSEFRVNTYTSSIQAYSSVKGLSDGKFIVVWHSSNQDDYYYGIYGQIYHSNGSTFGTEFRIASALMQSQSYPALENIGNGKFITSWQGGGDRYEIYAKIYKNTGETFGNEFRVNTNISSVYQYKFRPSVAGLTNDKFVVTWSSSYQDGSDYGIFGQRFALINTVPTLTINQLTIYTNGTTTISAANLSATDAELPIEKLTFFAYDIQNGKFQRVTNVTTEVTSFLQEQITTGEIKFIHTGGIDNNPPSYKISVSDGQLSTAPIPVTINFNPTSLPTTDSTTEPTTNNDTTWMIVGIAGGSALAVAAALITIFAVIKHRKSKQEDEYQLAVLTSTRTSRAVSHGKMTTILAAGETMEIPNIDIAEIKSPREIGKGANGSVFAGEWKKRSVALKKLPASKTDAAEEFSKEVAAMYKLSTDPERVNIVELFGINLRDDGYWIVMEFMQKTLKSFIHEEHTEKAISGSVLLQIFEGILNGLAFMHNKNMLHRDLKPGNILLDKDNNPNLADFGLSREVGLEMTAYAGTPTYMAPEIMKSDDNKSSRYGKKADVYSFGLIMWELLARRVPYSEIKSATTYEFCDAILKGTRPKISSSWPILYTELAQACWKQSPKERPEMKTIKDEKLEQIKEELRGHYHNNWE